ncbi:MAG: hypothetical protein E7J78_08495, partial [Pantoea sp.]|nr:hypothetical protein [Pantoea sp.]
MAFLLFVRHADSILLVAGDDQDSGGLVACIFGWFALCEAIWLIRRCAGWITLLAMSGSCPQRCNRLVPGS